MENPDAIELGLLLLTLNEEFILEINKGIKLIADRTNRDGKHHDITFGIKEKKSGLTIHCNNDSIDIAGPRLELHCERRKYLQKAKSWLGICLDPRTLELKRVLIFDSKWKWDKEMEKICRETSANKLNNQSLITGKQTQKIGRNDPCPCGSGLKYKKCCIDKNRIFS